MRVRDTFARRRRRLGRIGRRDAAGPGVREGRLWFFARLTGTLVGSHDSNIRGAGPEPGDFESLVDRHYGALYRFAMSLTRNESEAGDLVQDTFLVWASKGQTLRDPSKAKAWLFTTLHRRFLEGRRRITRFPEVELEEAEGVLPSVEPEAVNRLDGRTLLALVGEVETQYRAPVALFYLEDYSYAEIAEVLDIPLGTVKSRIARGLAQLKVLVSRGRPAPPEGGGR